MPPRIDRARRRRSALLSIASICALSLPATALIAASPSSAEDAFAGGTKVSQGAIAGDGTVAQGYADAPLTDGVGATWLFNTASMSSTTSASASGAVSEASFLNPTVASTVDGGTTTMTMTDAFDTYSQLRTFVGVPPVTTTTTASDALLYENLGAQPTSSCDGQGLDYPEQVNGVLTVSRKVFVPSDAGYARWIDTVTNTSDETTTATVYLDSNLGSDSNTLIFDSSTGDTTGDESDSWVGTFQNFSGTAPGARSFDPRIGHVMQGDGAQSALTEAYFADGDDDLLWTYELSLAPGQTSSILTYAVLRGTQDGVSEAAAAIAADAPQACMTQDEANAVVNFDGLGTDPTLTLPSGVTAPATGPTGATVTYDASAVDGNNQPIPVTCTPASGSVFASGVTTVTCTATDAQGRTSTGTFNVTVGAYTPPPVVTPPPTPIAETCAGETVTIVAAPGVATMGTAGKDVILGTAGADTISSFGGNDVICGVDGDDLIKAGGGKDKVLAGAGDDTVKAAGGNDKVVAGAGDDTVKGGGGNDRIRGNGGKDELSGNGGNDKLAGGAAKDKIYGNGGDDKLTGGAGKDKLRGGKGRDLVDGQVS